MIKKTLELFDKKTKELYESKFSEDIKGSGFTISATIGQPVNFSRRGPDYESIKAYALTFRQFTLDTDPISLRNISKIYDQLPDCELKSNFVDARNKLNSFLDDKSTLNINNEHLTFRKIMDTFFYGDMFHLNEKKTEEYERWIALGPLIQENLINDLVYTLGQVTDCIYYINQLNKQLLEKLEKSGRGSK